MKTVVTARTYGHELSLQTQWRLLPLPIWFFLSPLRESDECFDSPLFLIRRNVAMSMALHRRFQPINVNPLLRPLSPFVRQPELRSTYRIYFTRSHALWFQRLLRNSKGFLTKTLSSTAKGYTGTLNFIVVLIMRLDCIESTLTTLASRLLCFALSPSIWKTICSEQSCAIMNGVGGIPNINA